MGPAKRPRYEHEDDIVRVLSLAPDATHRSMSSSAVVSNEPTNCNNDHTQHSSIGNQLIPMDDPYIYRQGLPYTSPMNYVMKDTVENSELIGKYRVIYARYSVGDASSPAFFNYHRSTDGTATVILNENKKLVVKFQYGKSDEDMSRIWAGTPMQSLSTSFAHYDFIESEEYDGSGLIIDSIKNLDMVSHEKSFTGHVSGGIAILDRAEAGRLFRDGYKKGTNIKTFETYEEGFKANQCYYDVGSHWMLKHKSLPKEIVLRIRQFLRGPPALLFEKNDLLIRAYWQSKDGKLYIYNGICCRRIEA